MEELFSQFYAFLPVLARMGGFFAVVPLFGDRGIPRQLKAGISVFLAIIVTPVVEGSGFSGDVFVYSLLLARELLVGLALGFAVFLLFAAIQLAGQFIDVPVGFGMANVFDARLGLSMPVFAQLYYAVAVLVFFAINAHYVLISALVNSYRTIPLGEAVFAAGLVESVVKTVVAMFALAFKISLPVIGTLFITDVCLGVLARTVPQINVFIVGFPLKIAVGIAIVMLGMPLYVQLLEAVFAKGQLLEWMGRIAASLGG